LLCHEPGSAVHFITSRCGNDPDQQTYEWLRKIGICAESVIVVNSPSDKPQMAKALNVQIAIDDKPQTVNGYAEVGIPHSYLMRRLYNTNTPMHKDTRTVGALTEFFFEDYLRQKAMFEKEV
jgi:hypothetical protein